MGSFIAIFFSRRLINRTECGEQAFMRKGLSSCYDYSCRWERKMGSPVEGVSGSFWNYALGRHAQDELLEKLSKLYCMVLIR